MLIQWTVSFPEKCSHILLQDESLLNHRLPRGRIVILATSMHETMKGTQVSQRGQKNQNQKTKQTAITKSGPALQDLNYLYQCKDAACLKWVAWKAVHVARISNKRIRVVGYVNLRRY